MANNRLVKIFYSRNGSKNRPLSTTFYTKSDTSIPSNTMLASLGKAVASLLTEDMSVDNIEVHAIGPLLVKKAVKVAGQAVLKSYWTWTTTGRLYDFLVNFPGQSGLGPAEKGEKMLLGLGALIHQIDDSSVGKMGRMLIRGIGHEGDYVSTASNTYPLPTWFINALNAIQNTPAAYGYIGNYLDWAGMGTEGIVNMHIKTNKTGGGYVWNSTVVNQLVGKHIKAYRGKKVVEE